LIYKVLEKYHYNGHGKHQALYGIAGIGHTTLSKMLNYKTNKYTSISLECMLKIIVLLGTTIKESRELLMYYCDFYIQGKSYKARVIRGIINWVGQESDRYDYGERFMMIQDWFDENCVKIRIY